MFSPLGDFIVGILVGAVSLYVTNEVLATIRWARQEKRVRAFIDEQIRREDELAKWELPGNKCYTVEDKCFHCRGTGECIHCSSTYVCKLCRGLGLEPPSMEVLEKLKSLWR